MFYTDLNKGVMGLILTFHFLMQSKVIMINLKYISNVIRRALEAVQMLFCELQKRLYFPVTVRV